LGDMGSAEFQKILPHDMASLTRMFPVLRRLRLGAAHWKSDETDPIETRRRAISALRELFAHIARNGPLILALDDLQWGDTESAALLQDLFAGTDSPPALWLACWRTDDEEAGPCLGALRGIESSAIATTVLD